MFTKAQPVIRLSVPLDLQPLVPRVPQYLQYKPLYA